MRAMLGIAGEEAVKKIDALHINRGAGRHYRIRMRYRGARKFFVGRYKYRSPQSAARKLAERMVNTNSSMTNFLAEGDVILCSDWYEPTIVLTIWVRKP